MIIFLPRSSRYEYENKKTSQCGGYSVHSVIFTLCMARLEKELNEIECCKGYEEVKGKCKRKFKSRLLILKTSQLMN